MASPAGVMVGSQGRKGFSQRAVWDYFSFALPPEGAIDSEAERHKNLLRAIIKCAYQDLETLPPSLWESRKTEIKIRKQIAKKNRQPEQNPENEFCKSTWKASSTLRRAQEAFRWLNSDSTEDWSYLWVLDQLDLVEPPYITRLKKSKQSV